MPSHVATKKIQKKKKKKVMTFSSLLNRGGENIPENVAQLVKGRKNLVFMLDQRKCNWRPSFTSKVDIISLKHHNNKIHCTGENLWSAAVAVTTKNTASALWRLHYADRPCSLSSCCFRWPSSKTDTDQLVRVLKLDHFQNPSWALLFSTKRSDMSLRLLGFNGS